MTSDPENQPHGTIPLERVLADWLLIEGLPVQKVADPTSYFRFDIADPNGLGFSVIHSKARPDVILIGTNIRLQFVTDRMKQMDPARALEFSKRLMMDLLRLGVYFDSLEPPLTTITLNVVLYDDAFGRTAFMGQVGLLRRAVHLVNVSVHTEFGQPIRELGFPRLKGPKEAP